MHAQLWHVRSPYAFVIRNTGYAAAMAYGLFLIIIALTAVQFRLQKRWVFYN